MDNRMQIDLEQDPLLADAADWFTRLQDPSVALKTVTDWQGWMSSDARHAKAYLQIEDLWRDFAAVPCPEGVPARLLAADDYDGSMPVGLWKARSRRKPGSGLAMAASLVVGTFLALGIWAFHSASSGELLETGVGENRMFTLDDGSQVALGGRTQVRVSMSDRARDLTLVRGEAFFHVAQDRIRPFSVRAGDARVIAIGTQFNVRRNEDDRVVVSVLEGKIVVEREPEVLPLRWLAPKRTGMRKPLSAGNRATIEDRDDEPPHTEPMVSADATAWRSGRLAFEGEPLRYVIEYVNRYTSRPIELSDERIGDLLITGTVRDDNISAWLASLGPALGIRAIEQPGRVILEKTP